MPRWRPGFPACSGCPLWTVSCGRRTLRSGVDASALLSGFAAQAPDLLLALPGLERIEVGADVWSRSEVDGRIELSGPGGTSFVDSASRPGQAAEANCRPGSQWLV